MHAARVWADAVPASHEQLAMFAARPRRDLRAANEALARVRAELGDGAVVRAVLRDGHLPEASFGWEPLVEVVPAAPEPKLVRVRSYAACTPGRRCCRRNRATSATTAGCSPASSKARSCASKVRTSCRAAGGRTSIQREYHYASLRRGDCLWVYFDRGRHRWFCHGAVE